MPNPINIIYPETISEFFTELAKERFPEPGSKQVLLAKYLEDALLHILKKRPENFKIQTGIDSLPVWLLKKVAALEHANLYFVFTTAAVREVVERYYTWHAFVPDDALKETIKPIVKWLGDVADHPADYPWTDDINSRSQVRRLARISSYEKALSLAARHNAMNPASAKKEVREESAAFSYPPFKEGEDYKVIEAGLKGKQWLIQMLTPTFLRDEGKHMVNCIGDGTANHNDYDEDHYGNYDSMLKDPDIMLLSYRDEEGPHIDFKVQDGVLVECEGRYKYRPPRKYENALGQILISQGWDIKGDCISATRLIKQKGGYHNIFILPEDASIQGDLPYANIKRCFATPRGLQVEGRLSFDGCKSDVTIGEGVYAEELKITRCPGLKRLPDHMVCTILELDFLPENVPTQAKIGRVVYTHSLVKKIEFSGEDFLAQLRSGAIHQTIGCREQRSKLDS